MLSNHAQDLINRALDGELSESEQAEFQALLSQSEQARKYSDELSLLAHRLAATPPVEPPDSLERDILSKIELPRPRKWFTRMAGWMQGRPISYGIAAAAGLLVTVAYYEMGPSRHSATDYSSLVGTLSRADGLRGVVQLDALEINSPAVQGNVTLSGKDDLRLLRFDIDSSVPVNVAINFEGTGLDIGGVARQSHGGSENLTFSDGNLTVAALGKQQFTVVLKSDGGEAMNPGGIAVSVSRDGEAVYEGVLNL